MSDTPTARTRRRLIGLNLALAGALGLVTLATGASRVTAQQVNAANRGRGDYSMVAGEVQGLTARALFVLDAANQQLLALAWDRNNNEVSIIGYRDLMADGQQRQSR